jgi:hypothetical protein
LFTLSSNPRHRPLPSPHCYPLSEAPSLAGGAWSSPTLMQSLSRTTPPTLAAIVARRPPKMSKIGSPRRLNVTGENLIENRDPDSRIRPTPVSRLHGPATPLTEVPPPGWSRPYPSARRPTLWIRSHCTPSIRLISALDPPTKGSHLMKSHGPVSRPPWTRSTTHESIPRHFL